MEHGSEVGCVPQANAPRTPPTTQTTLRQDGKYKIKLKLLLEVMVDSTRYWAPTGAKLTSTAFAGWSRGGAMGRPQPDNLVRALNDSEPTGTHFVGGEQTI